MTTFQIIGVTIAGTMATVVAVAMLRGSVRRLTALPWLALWTAATIALIQPQWTTRVAHALGIGRGADVVLYAAVLGGLVIALRLSLAVRHLERQTTVLVRELALLRAELDYRDVGTETPPTAEPGVG